MFEQKQGVVGEFQGFIFLFQSMRLKVAIGLNCGNSLNVLPCTLKKTDYIGMAKINGKKV